MQINHEFIAILFLLFFLIFNLHVIYDLRLKNIFTVFSVFIYILFVRLRDSNGDIGIYLSSIDSIDFSLYFMKEPIFWIYIWFIKIIFGGKLVFIVSDIIMCVVCAKILKLKSLPLYYLPVFFILFFSFLGHQNIYRQWVATLFFILFFDKKYFNMFFIFIHNFLLLPVIVNFIKNKKIIVFIFLCLTYFLLNMIPIGYTVVETGNDSVVMLCVLSILYLYFLNNFSIHYKIIYFINIMFCVCILIVFQFSSTYSERYFYFFFVFIAVEILSILSRSRYKIYSSIFVLINTLPIFFTSLNSFIF